MTKVLVTIALGVALSGCGPSGQPGYSGSSSVGSTATARDPVNNGKSNSSGMDADSGASRPPIPI